MITKGDTLDILHRNAKDIEGLLELYRNGIGVIQHFAVEKKIEFDGYFLKKWEIEAEHPVSFNEEYFENENRSELFVFLAAEADIEIYECLEYLYNFTHAESLSKHLLYKKIYELREQGVRF
ncbi:hypothetical protein OMO38_19175 [Chryseobacterium sp. 09-1422]|uniref:IPExxxVDY family protein n=1 Tax=Chryseobacterium kimseyorum TaxID=2984028 RepID=A0ABT3I3K9_9FLAO|nr:hypothetical protein [Chryseobacterium kimseyorum]MCW3170657.1 hypothetical protein [Chryseobacterium kimseyorum]